MTTTLTFGDRVWVLYEDDWGTVVRLDRDGVDVRLDHDGEVVNCAFAQLAATERDPVGRLAPRGATRVRESLADRLRPYFREGQASRTRTPW